MDPTSEYIDYRLSASQRRASQAGRTPPRTPTTATPSPRLSRSGKSADTSPGSSTRTEPARQSSRSPENLKRPPQPTRDLSSSSSSSSPSVNYASAAEQSDTQSSPVSAETRNKPRLSGNGVRSEANTSTSSMTTSPSQATVRAAERRMSSASRSQPSVSDHNGVSSTPSPSQSRQRQRASLTSDPMSLFRARSPSTTERDQSRESSIASRHVRPPMPAQKTSSDNVARTVQRRTSVETMNISLAPQTGPTPAHTSTVGSDMPRSRQVPIMTSTPMHTRQSSNAHATLPPDERLPVETTSDVDRLFGTTSAFDKVLQSDQVIHRSSHEQLSPTAGAPASLSGPAPIEDSPAASKRTMKPTSLLLAAASRKKQQRASAMNGPPPLVLGSAFVNIAPRGSRSAGGQPDFESMLASDNTIKLNERSSLEGRLTGQASVADLRSVSNPETAALKPTISRESAARSPSGQSAPASAVQRVTSNGETFVDASPFPATTDELQTPITPSGRAPTIQSLSSRSQTFSSTMRKTSGFFRKALSSFSAPTTTPGRSAGISSADMDIYAPTSSADLPPIAPPVPAMPARYKDEALPPLPALTDAPNAPPALPSSAAAGSASTPALVSLPIAAAMQRTLSSSSAASEIVGPAPAYKGSPKSSDVARLRSTSNHGKTVIPPLPQRLSSAETSPQMPSKELRRRSLGLPSESSSPAQTTIPTESLALGSAFVQQQLTSRRHRRHSSNASLTAQDLDRLPNSSTSSNRSTIISSLARGTASPTLPPRSASLTGSTSLTSSTPTKSNRRSLNSIIDGELLPPLGFEDAHETPMPTAQSTTAGSINVPKGLALNVDTSGELPPVSESSRLSALLAAASAEARQTRLSGGSATLPSPILPRELSSVPDWAEGHAPEELALKFWNNEEGFLRPQERAEWLGSLPSLNQRTLLAYIGLFDFAGLRIDAAFRLLCDRLYLKGETQQIDRILAAFSARYHEQNLSGLLHSVDLIHAVVYSILLLNTDLHVVESTTRMSRNQFVRNTMSAIYEQPEAQRTVDAMGDARKNAIDKWTASLAQTDGTMHRSSSASSALSGGQDSVLDADPADQSMSSAKSNLQPAALRRGSTDDASNRQEVEPFTKAWDVHMESLLRDLFQSIRSKPVYQNSAHADDASSMSSRPGSTLSPTPTHTTWSGVTRVPSKSSHAASISGSERNVRSNYKRTSMRGLLLAEHGKHNSSSAGSAMGSASDRDSIMSGNASMINAMGQHQMPNLGFASSLSNTIIREQQEDEADTTVKDDTEVTEEELALMGAPWAKEGLLQRKHYWEGPQKRAKDKAWEQVFMVLSRGDLRAFKFGQSMKGMQGSYGLGGGNWLSNAQAVGDVDLAHSLTSPLPVPGYSRTRPFVFALTLPNGNSYFFQAGTADLVAEWVSACNYWAARVSKLPLVGGVSSMDYGWNHANDADHPDGSSVARDRSTSIQDDRMSVRSGRSNRSRQVSSGVSNTTIHDRLALAEWKPYAAPLGKTHHDEMTQRELLKQHVVLLQEDLQQHNVLRGPMQRLYSAKSANAGRAMYNWERKSQYLLSEIVKYTTYISCIEDALRLRNVRRDEKLHAELLKNADDLDEDTSFSMASKTPKSSNSATFKDV
ncbi:uncharacterized protein L969DRAFT_55427 [Mixia osmundae IAM 14324]|uniref:SEC7 domain-containing protein n=1 Tax=Mixia osmundae (strain CBS 9802 / IAM 14324 / JCM 22182 / KY 12970) TaxID=764103 RepID=G7E4I7_MIXOS|nr:uncharacterized protein L969DRAFT_55427 [Mixia osmundae IAM 14324]KEI36236.1 hypothetical protein L969DRAFT_55427 [Mixia osmundae IAM 14324]GAA97747.1 hypothetical protein E5Q_04426 [Mixia osmundae IAM 14324]